MNWIYPDGMPIAMSLTAYNAFLTGLMVLLKRKDKAGVHYFIYSFNVFLWGIGISFMLNNDLPAARAAAWGTFSQVLAIFIPMTWFNFVVVYTNTVQKYQGAVYLFSIASLALFLFSFGKQFVQGYHSMVGFKYYPIPGPVYYFFTIFFVIVILFAFYVFIDAIKNENIENKKRDYRWILWVSFYAFGMGSLTFFPVYGVSFPQYNLILMPVWQILLTYAMIHHQAFDAEKMAQAAHRDKLAAIGTLATSINHEVRNPLFVIRGLAETCLINIAENSYGSAEAALAKSSEAFKRMEQQAVRAMDIMRRFALFAKQNTHVKPEFTDIKLAELLENILPLVEHELRLDKIELIRNIPSSLEIYADRRHIEEILFNIVVNACHVLKQTGGRIEITAKPVEDKIILEINDNGPGMAESTQKQIFNPFYTTKEEGTGLGLYVTKQLVERNNGKISVKSKLSQGTAFILEFHR